MKSTLVSAYERPTWNNPNNRVMKINSRCKGCSLLGISDDAVIAGQIYQYYHLVAEG